MEQTKSTPGPWVQGFGGEPFVIGERKTLKTIADVKTTRMADGEAEANARLISSAPLMLEALKRAKELLRAACELITNNNLYEYTAVWDGAQCDGNCYIDDAQAALVDIRRAIAAAEPKA